MIKTDDPEGDQSIDIDAVLEKKKMIPMKLITIHPSQLIRARELGYAKGYADGMCDGLSIADEERFYGSTTDSGQA
tara:strand:- start:224 stop:451 length:228 start_codon:yes stop_codon:yes gene_type:complete